ncbi:MAG: isocitrate/isopropylmalate family dehydrogenase [Tepidisphaeraceae bacterium]
MPTDRNVCLLIDPIATFLSVAMMLEYLHQPAAAQDTYRVCAEVVAGPRNQTGDLRGTATTTQVGDAIRVRIG